MAVDMFDAGDALMARGHIHEACPKYAESYRLDPQLGALLHWADCLEQDGKLASAYAAFRDANELAARRADPRGTFAAERVTALEPRLSRVILTATGGLPAQLVVQLDSLNIVESSLGVGIAVDPGQHAVRASAPGFEPFSSSLVVRGEGQVYRVTLPALKPVPPEPKPSPTAGHLAAAPKPAFERTREDPRWPGAGLAGAGVVALGVSAGFFASMAHRLAQRDDLCPHDPCPAGTDRSRVRALESDARSAEAWALGLSISGAVAVAAGVILYLRSPVQRTTVAVATHSGALPGIEWRF